MPQQDSTPPPGPAGGNHPLRRLFASPDFVRLWAVGGLANAMRWVEILDWAGQLAVWHLAIVNLLGGLAWTGEMAARRRMVSEAAGEGMVVQGMAFDSTTSNTTRMAGPLIGGLIYQTLGAGAAYALAAACYAVAIVLLAGVRVHQAPGRFAARQVLADMVDGVGVVRRHRPLQAVILVTIGMNVFGFCYTAVLPAFGTLAFGASPFQIGLLTAAEPAGALITGLALATRRGVPMRPGLMIGGAAGFMVALLALPAMPAIWQAVGLLMLGGIGTALFATLQTAIPVTTAPPEARSRVLGLVTTCIGMGPVGVLAIGALADAQGPGFAIILMAALGLLLFAVAAPRTLRR